jgi:hypothetical protein
MRDVGKPEIGGMHHRTQSFECGIATKRERTVETFARKPRFLSDDGYADLLVGAPMDDDIDKGLKDAGRITVFSGNGGTFMAKKIRRGGEGLFWRRRECRRHQQ